jgi:hypothetical protein
VKPRVVPPPAAPTLAPEPIERVEDLAAHAELVLRVLATHPAARATESWASALRECEAAGFVERLKREGRIP